MRYKSDYLVFLFLALPVVFIGGCRDSGTVKKQEAPEIIKAAAPVTGQETMLLLKDLKENGDYVNSRYFPSLIKASVVFDELDKNNLIVDIRSPESFGKGHIRKAVNRSFSSLPEYFETGIRPFEYDKIIIVCDDGQLSSYTTSLLRMMGYGNVYALRWGMGGWNRNYAESGWMKGVSGKYEDRLETAANESPVAKEMPELNTGLTSGKEIGQERFRKLFADGIGDILVTADDVFSDPAKYFVINFERKDKYDDGHIPGAVRYKPEATLGFTDVMATIPSDRTVVVYCGTGHNSGFATAYLRLFGYDARTLKYGNNSFMYNKMKSERTVLAWLPFTPDESGDYPVVK